MAVATTQIRPCGDPRQRQFALDMGAHGRGEMVEFIRHFGFALLAQRQGIVGENRQRRAQAMGEIGGTATGLFDHRALGVEELVHRRHRRLELQRIVARQSAVAALADAVDTFAKRRERPEAKGELGDRGPDKEEAECGQRRREILNEAVACLFQRTTVDGDRDTDGPLPAGGRNANHALLDNEGPALRPRQKIMMDGPIRMRIGRQIEHRVEERDRPHRLPRRIVDDLPVEPAIRDAKARIERAAGAQ